MNRRALLAMAGGALPLFTGCAGIMDDQPTPTSIDRTDAGPVPEFEGCPPFVTTERADCGTADPAVTLTPSSRIFEEDEADDTIELFRLTLENRSSTVFEFDPDAWRLYRRGDSDDAWDRVPRDSPGGSPVRLDPDETYDYFLATVAHPTPQAQNRTSVVVDLDSGTVYGFLLAGTLDPDGDPADVACVTRFRYVRSTP